ncbi:MAG TPA: hypothetical protein VNT79_15395 [Phycisphaerae bacterium]|nr:hypothetical protein [Phycisphaerae bacterium]
MSETQVRWRIGTLIGLAACGVAGCAEPKSNGAPADDTLTVEGILERAEKAYTELYSLEASGTLRDYRGGQKRVQPIRWELLRPDLCRVQIGMNLVLVKGQNWWSFDEKSGRFKSHREQGPTPIETATYFLSDGIPLMTPVAWNRPKVAFGPNELRSSWVLQGVAWTAGRPSYIVSRDGRGRDGGSRWTLWIDQDRFLILAWTWATLAGGPDGKSREEIVWGATYEALVTDRAISPDRFRIERPEPIVLPRPAAADQNTQGMNS